MNGGEQRIWTVVVIVAAAALVGTALPAGLANGQQPGDTSLFTRIGQPGSPEGLYVDGDRVFVGTHTPVFGNSDQGPSHIFVYNRTDASLMGDITVENQSVNETHGLLGMAMDDSGRLYVVDRNPPRVIRLTLTTNATDHVLATDQEVYANFTDLPTCTAAMATGEDPCSPTTLDQAPFPDDVAFAPDGDLYVTDLEQAVLYRVPAGGIPQGENAEIWFSDARLDSIFGANGIETGPNNQTLYFAMTGHSLPATTSSGGVAAPTQGAIYTLPLQDQSPSADDLELFHAYTQPAAGPDGFTIGASGNVYVALAGASQMSILDANGNETLRFPDPVENQQQTVPYDLPASVAFDDEDGTLLVTNQVFFTGDENHWAVLEAFVDDTDHERLRPTVPG